MGLRQSAAKHCEILAVHKHQAPVDHAVASDNPITWNFLVLHAKVCTTVLDKHIPLFERTSI